MNWTVPQIWKGGSCVILGGGSSIVKQFNIPNDIVQGVCEKRLLPSSYSPFMESIHNRHVLGVNMSYKLGNWVDVLFFGDEGFIEKSNKDLFLFPGLRVSCMETKIEYPSLKIIKRDHKKWGLSFNPSTICWNLNSGGAAINLAVLLGVKQIILLGYDMNLGEKNNQHWHNYYGSNLKTVKATMSMHMRCFPKIAEDALGKVEILNANPESAIQSFPKVNLRDVLCNIPLYFC